MLIDVVNVRKFPKFLLSDCGVPMQTFLKTAVLSLSLGLLGTASAHAALIIQFDQEDGFVVATGMGRLNFVGLGDPVLQYEPGGIAGTPAFFSTSQNGGQTSVFSGITGPASIGPGSGVNPVITLQGDGSSFDSFGFDIQDGVVFFPDNGGQSDAKIFFQLTYESSTFASLGLKPGSYTYTYPTDSFTINIGPQSLPPVSNVPLPASAPLFGAGLIALGMAGCAAKRKKAGAEV